MLHSRDLLALSRRELAKLLRSGHGVRPEMLAGHTYNGTSLGLPRWVERLTWKTFRKAFHADPERGGVRGWNVRVAQGSRAERYEPLERHGVPCCFGHFRVLPLDPGADPLGARSGVLLDYGQGGNAPFDPTARLRDPVVALRPGSADLLLGWSYVDVFGARLGTPSFFALERGEPVTHIAQPPLEARWRGTSRPLP